MALRMKIDALNATRATHPAAGMITEREAMAAVGATLGPRMSYTWLAQNGVGGLTAQAARAVFRVFLESVRELDPAQQMALLRPAQQQLRPAAQPATPAQQGQQEGSALCLQTRAASARPWIPPLAA